MEYIVVSTAVTDDLYLSDQTHKGYFLGGAGSYALCGLRLWTDQALLVTGVGEDFEQMYGAWFRKNKIPMQGLMVKDPYSSISTVRYQPDGERVETPPHGLEHYQRLEAAPAELEPFLSGAKGVYLFKDDDPDYWSQLLLLQKKHGFRLLWELNASCAVPAQCASVRELARSVDVLSLNEREAYSLLSARSLKNAAAQLGEWEIPLVFLRMGARGAMLLADGKQYLVPPVTDAVVVDATGGGNSSSAAVLYGYCNDFHPVQCGIMGSIAAAMCIRQYGVPPLFDAALSAQAQQQLEQMMHTQLPQYDYLHKGD